MLHVNMSCSSNRTVLPRLAFVNFFLISQIAIGFLTGPTIVFQQYFGISGLIIYCTVLFVAISSFAVWILLQYLRSSYYASFNRQQLFFLAIMMLCPLITTLLISGPYRVETLEFANIVINWTR